MLPAGVYDARGHGARGHARGHGAAHARARVLRVSGVGAVSAVGWVDALGPAFSGRRTKSKQDPCASPRIVYIGARGIRVHNIL